MSFLGGIVFTFRLAPLIAAIKASDGETVLANIDTVDAEAALLGGEALLAILEAHGNGETTVDLSVDQTIVLADVGIVGKETFTAAVVED